MKYKDHILVEFKGKDDVLFFTETAVTLALWPRRYTKPKFLNFYWLSYDRIADGCLDSDNQVSYSCLGVFDLVEGRLWENHKHESGRGQIELFRMGS